MKIGITSLFDSVLDIGSDKFQMINSSSRVEIEIFEKQEIVLLVYPTEDLNLLSYAVTLVISENILQTKNQHINIKEVKVGEYEIELLPFELKTNSFHKISKANISGYEIRLHQGKNNYISVDDGTDIFFKEFFGKVLRYEFFEMSGKPASKITTEEEQILFIFDSEKEDFFVFKGQQIDINNNEFTLTYEFFDFAKHATEKKYIINEDGKVEMLEQELLYIKENPQKTRVASIIPYAFFEAIKAKNFLLAKEYLTPFLAQSVSMEMLEEYFGDFENIKPYNFQKDKGYFININNKNSSKIFRLKIENGLIAEIEQIGSH